MKKFLSIVFALAMLVTLVSGASAADDNRFLIPGHVTVQGTNVSFCTRAIPSDATVKVTIDSQPVSHTLSTVGDAGTPIVYYCLVDTSTAMGNQQVALQKDTLTAISAAMQPQDSMILAALGSTLKESAPLTNKDERDAAITGLAREGFSIDLYAGIRTAVEHVASLADQNTHYCLVILSAGIDNRGTVSEEQVIAAISETNVPVFAIGVLMPNSDAYARKFADALGRMAEASVDGGYAALNVFKDVTPADSGNAVCRSMRQQSVVSVSTANIVGDGSDKTLTITCEAHGETYTGTLTVPASAFLAEGNNDTDSTEPTTTPVNFIKDHIVLIGSGVAVAVLLVILLVILMLRSRRKYTEDYSTSSLDYPDSVMSTGDPGNVVEDTPPTGAISSPIPDFPIPDSTPSFVPAPAEDNFPATTPLNTDDFISPPTPTLASCKVRVTGVTNPPFYLEFQAPKSQSITLGRNRRSQVILNGNDPRISGIHMELEWDGSDIYVRDRASTNGTFINGTQLAPQAWAPLHSGDIVRIGGNDYRFEYR